MRRPTRTLARISTLAVIPAALLAAGVAVSTASYSAFSATSSDDANNWSMGTVALTNDAANGALFSASNLKPGSTGTNCIAVTSSGSLASAVKLYATNVQQTKALASSVNLQIKQGTGGGYGTCAGFTPTSGVDGTLYNDTLASFASTHTDYATGIGTWKPAGDKAETKTFQITYTVSPDAPASLMGATASLGFTWEAQNS
ncbi:hypothetical protein DEI81_13675 [Curtobacterium sp. MCBD17_013]|uniref:hypothetical protein n=1 Tax=Curtobacterium sp. MCBD17_013 TaxID=2175668 RepID=UPI000DA9C0A3|nr:hypothetical protein [Curtobacterium sp. MCBD17_013]PZF59437.1 hypothetical protein DEI81_13675 [Curtobacterium sp. MCBD17_013]